MDYRVDSYYQPKIIATFVNSKGEGFIQYSDNEAQYMGSTIPKIGRILGFGVHISSFYLCGLVI